MSKWTPPGPPAFPDNTHREISASFSRVVLTDAQIKAVTGSPTNLYEMVPAPGAGKVLIPLAGLIVVDFPTAAYTNIDAGDAFAGIVLGTRITGLLASFQNNGSTKTSFSGLFAPDPLRKLVAPLMQVASGTEPFALVDIAEGENQPISLELYNGSGALTGGNAAQSLAASVFYTVFQLP